MKRRITLSIALALSVLLSLVSFPATAQGQQQPRRFFACDPGLLTPGPGQILRVTAAPAEGNYTFEFRRIEYTQGGCNSDGVCKQIISSQTTSGPITVMPNEAASMDITPMPGSSGVRVVVLSKRRNARMVFKFIDAAGRTTTVIHDGVCTEAEE